MKNTPLPLSRRTFTAGLISAGLLHNEALQAADKLLNPASSGTDKLIIYQIFTRLFGNQNQTNKRWGSRDENGVGKFNDITDKALQEIRKFGVSHVWYTGVIEHATMTDYSVQGIQKDNPQVVKGRAGSPYAIKDYYDVDPDLAVDVPNRMAEFEALLKRSHANELKVIIDFVPNHVAREYQSDAKPDGIVDMGQHDDKTKVFNQENNFYYLPDEPFQVPDGVSLPPGLTAKPYVENPAKATGNDVFRAKPSADDWYETVKLNYGIDYQNNQRQYFDPIPSTWRRMRDILVFWAEKGVDGFRCDVAEFVPVEFWGWVIPQVKAVRSTRNGTASQPVVFIAEIYNPKAYKDYVQIGKFDYLYDKVGLYDALRRLMEGKGTVADITGVQHELGTISNHLLRFLENHDEQRIASRFFANNPWAAVPAMTVAATLHTGPMMLYFGQELGVNPTQAEGFQGDDGRTTIFDYWGVPEYQAWTNGGKFDGAKLTADQKKLRQFYGQLNGLVNQSDAIRTGGFYDLQAANTQSAGYDQQRLYSYLRYAGNQKLLIIGNFDKEKTAKTTVQIPAEAWRKMKLSATKTHSFTDIFLTKTKLTGKSSIAVQVPPLGVLVLAVN